MHCYRPAAPTCYSLPECDAQLCVRALQFPGRGNWSSISGNMIYRVLTQRRNTSHSGAEPDPATGDHDRRPPNTVRRAVDLRHTADEVISTLSELSIPYPYWCVIDKLSTPMRDRYFIVSVSLYQIYRYYIDVDTLSVFDTLSGSLPYRYILDIDTLLSISYRGDALSISRRCFIDTL